MVDGGRGCLRRLNPPHTPAAGCSPTGPAPRVRSRPSITALCLSNSEASCPLARLRLRVRPDSGRQGPAAAVQARGPQPKDLRGIGPAGAARILADVGDEPRFPGPQPIGLVARHCTFGCLDLDTPEGVTSTALRGRNIVVGNSCDGTGYRHTTAWMLSRRLPVIRLGRSSYRVQERLNRDDHRERAGCPARAVGAAACGSNVG